MDESSRPAACSPVDAMWVTLPALDRTKKAQRRSPSSAGKKPRRYRPPGTQLPGK